MEKFVSIARRSGDRWFVGSMNSGERRTLEIPLDFLEPGVTYTASIHSDASPEGKQRTKAASSNATVDSTHTLKADMAFNGGHAIILTPTDSTP